MGVPALCSAPSLGEGDLGAAATGIAVKVAANSRQAEVRSSMSAFNYPEGDLENTHRAYQLCHSQHSSINILNLVNKPFIT